MRKPWCTAKIGICKDCGIEALLSQHNLCLSCSKERFNRAVEEMAMREGEAYKRCREGLWRSFKKIGKKGRKRVKMRKPWNTAKVGVCRDCGRLMPLSQHNLCRQCSKERLNKAVEELKRKEGEAYKRCREGLRRSRNHLVGENGTCAMT